MNCGASESCLEVINGCTESCFNILLVSAYTIKLKMNHVSTPAISERPQCYNSQLKPTYHGMTSRYTSPSTGKCKPLVVQSVKPNSTSDWIESRVRSNRPVSTDLAGWLTRVMSHPSGESFLWLFVWLIYIIALLCPSRVPVHTTYYKPYLMRFVGHL